jgi:hypothetical protein
MEKKLDSKFCQREIQFRDLEFRRNFIETKGDIPQMNVSTKAAVLHYEFEQISKPEIL